MNPQYAQQPQYGPPIGGYPPAGYPAKSPGGQVPPTMQKQVPLQNQQYLPQDGMRGLGGVGLPTMPGPQTPPQMKPMAPPMGPPGMGQTMSPPHPGMGQPGMPPQPSMAPPSGLGVGQPGMGPPLGMPPRGPSGGLTSPDHSRPPGPLPSQPAQLHAQPTQIHAQPTQIHAQASQHPAQPAQLASQMQNMNINGVHRPQHAQPPQMKPGYPTIAGSGYPPINGNTDLVNGDARHLQQRYPQQQPSQMQGYGAGPQTGYPTQAGYPAHAQYPTTQPGYPPQPQYPQQPQQKLNPDNMPSPMQVVIDDQKTKSGLFYTNQKGQVPPLVTTDFVVQDQGNASPRFVRSTMYWVPITQDIMKQTSVPFGLVLSPMADVCDGESPPPLVDLGEQGPIRCIRCKAYMCPNMQFIDGGRRFHCLLCKASTEVPAEYFQHLDHTGMRMDRFERPELILGAYEFVATKEYCRESVLPKPPAVIFILDVSYNNVKSGLVSLLCGQMKQLLQSLPKEVGQERSPMRVGFITYNKSVHFYNINGRLGQPQMMVVGDVNDMFMPLLEGFLVDVTEAEQVIDSLMEQIPAMFSDTKETETILAPAIQAGLEALKASGVAGKLLVFHSSLPIFEAPGKLRNRDDRKLLGTDKEKSVLTPQNTVYNNLGQECVGAGCSVDLFVFNNSYIDLATIGQVSRLTGGDIFKYTYFQADLDGDRVLSDIEKTISRLYAFDAIMRIRTSAGVRPTDFYGHFFMSNATDIELAAITPDKAMAIEIKHDDKLTEEDGVYIQVALLYTSISGQRKIRVLNLALKACSQMADLYRTCELDTLVNFFSKQALMRLSDSTPKAVKDALIAKSAQVLACYRKNCATPTSSSQLVLPECMKLLPLYVNCLLRSDALSGGSDMTVDDRWYTMAVVMTMDVPSSVVYFYPRLVSLHDLDENSDTPPTTIRCSAEKMSDDGVYLLENGIYMFIWIGLAARSDWLMSVFGIPSAAQVDVERSHLPVLDTPMSARVRGLIESLSQTNSRSIRLTLVRQRDKMEVVMKHFLVEDRGVDGSTSYVDFLCHMHREIRSILSS